MTIYQLTQKIAKEDLFIEMNIIILSNVKLSVLLNDQSPVVNVSSLGSLLPKKNEL